MVFISAGPQSGVLSVCALYLLLLRDSELSLSHILSHNAFLFFSLPNQAFHLLLNLTQKIASSLLSFISWLLFSICSTQISSYKMLFIVACD